MPDSVCDLATADTFFLVDCDKVECDCCTCGGANIGIFEEHVTPFLSNTTIENMLIDGTPQQLAYDYLILGPSLETYEPERLLTRFALATFFWSTDGIDSWKFQKNWMEWTHECNWHSTESYNNLPSCDEDLVYRRLMLKNNDLRGTIPEELALIPNLGMLRFELIERLFLSCVSLYLCLTTIFFRMNQFVPQLCLIYSHHVIFNTYVHRGDRLKREY